MAAGAIEALLGVGVEGLSAAALGERTDASYAKVDWTTALAATQDASAGASAGRLLGHERDHQLGRLADDSVGE